MSFHNFSDLQQPNFKSAVKAGKILGIGQGPFLQLPNQNLNNSGGAAQNVSWWNFGSGGDALNKRANLNRSGVSGKSSNANNSYYNLPYVAGPRPGTPSLAFGLGTSHGQLPASYLAQTFRDVLFNSSSDHKQFSKTSGHNSSFNSAHAGPGVGNSGSTASGSGPSVKLASKEHQMGMEMFELPSDTGDQTEYGIYGISKPTIGNTSYHSSSFQHPGTQSNVNTANRRISFAPPLPVIGPTTGNSRTTLSRPAIRKDSLERNKRLSVISVTALQQNELDSELASNQLSGLDAVDAVGAKASEHTEKEEAGKSPRTDGYCGNSVDDVLIYKLPHRALQMELLKSASLVPNLIQHTLEIVLKQWKQSQMEVDDQLHFKEDPGIPEDKYLLSAHWKGEVINKALYEEYQTAIIESFSGNSKNMVISDALGIMLLFVCWSGDQALLVKLINVFKRPSNEACSFISTQQELDLRKALRARTNTASSNRVHGHSAVNHTGNEVLFSESKGRVSSGKALVQYPACTPNTGNRRVLLSEELDFNVKDDEGRTPLMLAAIRGHEKCVETLLEAEVSLVLKDNYNQTVVHWAARMGHVNVLKVLLKRGIAHLLTAQDDMGYTPLHSAVLADTKECLALLLMHCPFQHLASLLQAVDFRGLSAFFLAVSLSKYTFIEEFAKQYARANFMPSPSASSENSVLHYAAQFGHHPRLFEILLQQYPNDLDMRNHEGKTPFHVACECGNNFAIQQFIEFLSKVPTAKSRKSLLAKFISGSKSSATKSQNDKELLEAIDNQGRTILHLAAASGKEAGIWLILEYVDFTRQYDSNRLAQWINKQDVYGATALHYAVKSGNQSALKALLIKKASILVCDQSKRTALFWACTLGQFELVHMLLFSPYVMENGAKNLESIKAAVEMRDVNGSTALHFAACAGDLKTCQLLVQVGSSVSALDNQMHSPLFKAAISGKPPVLEYLIGEYDDWRAFEQEQYRDLFEEFEAAKAKEAASDELMRSLKAKAENFICCKGVAEQDSNGRTMLHWCANLGLTDCVALLCDAGAPINAKDNSGSTPLHEAASAGQHDAALWLISNGADINCYDGAGCTALHWAAANAHLEVCKLLVANRAKINAMELSSDRDTPLDYALLSSKSSLVVPFLVSSGALTFEDLKTRAVLLVQRAFRIRKAKLKVPVSFLFPKATFRINSITNKDRCS